MSRREREPGEWRTLEAMWAVRDATAPSPGNPPTLSSEQGRVLAALLLFVDAEGQAYPGATRIARLAGMHPHRVRRVLAGLEHGAGPLKLTVTRQRRNRRGEQDTHLYQLAFVADGTSSLEKTAARTLTDPHQQSPEDATTRLQKTAPPVSRRRHHPSPEDDKADPTADTGADRNEDTGALTHADGSIEALPFHEDAHDITRSFFADEPAERRIIKPMQTPNRRARKPKPRPDAVARAVEEAEGRIKAKDWSGASAVTLVGLYAHLHQGVYGVAPEELADDWLPALSSAKRCLQKDFDGDVAAARDFVRWSWQREKRSRKRNPDSDFRMGWRYQFSRRLLTDFRVAVNQ